MTDHNLDLRGMACPVTTIRLKRHLKAIPPGTTFDVLADDDEAKVDFPAVVNTTKNDYVAFEDLGNYQKYTIHKK